MSSGNRFWPAAVLALALGGARVGAAEKALVPVLLPDGHTIHAEFVTTMEDRIMGLMHRVSLPDDEGMLFLFEEEGAQPITMRNMQFDLDVLFLGSDQRIRDLFEAVPHPSTSAAEGPAKTIWGRGLYVLEVPSGTIRRHGLAVGAALTFTLPGEAGSD